MTAHRFPLQRIDGPPVAIPGDGDRWTIGRALDCDLVLPGQAVSRRHALIGFDDGPWIEDLDSAGGIRVNGAPVARVALRDGDLVEIGSWQFVCRSGGGISIADTSPALQPSRLDLLLDLLTTLRLDNDEATLCRLLATVARSGTGYARAVVVQVSADGLSVLAAEPTGVAADELSRTLIDAARPGQVMRLRTDLGQDRSASLVRQQVHSALVAGIGVDGAPDVCLYLDARGDEAAEAPDVARFCLALAQVAGSQLSARAAAQRLWTERERIYRDLHDDLGSRLLGLIHRAPDESLAEQARLMLRDLRDVVSAEPGGFQSLESVLAQVRAEAGERCDAAAVRLVLAPLDQPLPGQISHARAAAMKRILREALTNGLKHAAPTNVRLAEHHGPDQLRIELAHDGRFEAPDGWSAGRGVRAIRERSLELGGTAGWRVEDRELVFALTLGTNDG